MTTESDWQRMALEAKADSKIANQRMDDHMRECSERYKQLVVQTDTIRRGLDSMRNLMISMVVTLAIGCLGVVATLLTHFH